jgi:hypothetical protein
MKELLSDYKKVIKSSGLEDEKYKWEIIRDYKGRPDLNHDMAEQIAKIDFQNIVYYMSFDSLSDIADNYGDELKEEFRMLRDESIDLTERIVRFNDNTQAYLLNVEVLNGSELDD